MVLQPLEFSDCLTDSPFFREKLHAHEKELEKTSKAIKHLVKECNDLLTAASQLSKAQRSFSKTLTEFQFECIGSEKTDDEIVIENSLKEFGKIVSGIEDARDHMLKQAYSCVVEPLEKFRKEKIGEAKKGRQTFEKQTSKFYQSHERYLNIKLTKISESQLLEADAVLEMERQNFCKESMQYVLRLQEVQERKKFEFVEILLQFMLGWLTFYHEGYEYSNDFKPFRDDLSLKLQKCRANFDATRDEAETLMKKMLEVRGPKPLNDHATLSRPFTREGYLLMQEKKALGVGTTWTKYYCQYQKDGKTLTMIPYNQLTSNKGPGGASKESYVLTSCVRRATESIDKRFCFDVTVVEKQQQLTLQANSEDDRRQWLDDMDGKEPIYSEPMSASQLGSLLDDIGFSFINKCITAIEAKGLEEEGLYRVVGVNSKVSKLTSRLLDRRKADRIDLSNDVDGEWEMKTITSALKNYFRSLPEPLMTFKLHQRFIRAAKQESKTLRINDIHELIHQLPESNFEMLAILILHLKKVSDFSHKNLMSVSNIGVCFGPTLMRPEEETMAAIMDIKFCNLIVEILIENYEKRRQYMIWSIFKTRPEFADISNTRVLDSRPLTTSQLKPSGSSLASSSYTNSMLSSMSSSTGATNNSKDSTPIHRNNYASVGGTPAVGAPPPSMTSSAISNTSSIYANPPADPGQALAHTHANLRSTIIRDPGHPAPYNSDHQNSASSSSESLNFRCSSSSMSTSHSNYSSVTRPARVTSQATSRPSTSASNAAARNLPRQKVRTLYSCTAENESELSFEPNQIITNVRQSKEPGWLEGTLDGKDGLIPANYVEFIK